MGQEIETDIFNECFIIFSSFANIRQRCKKKAKVKCENRHELLPRRELWGSTSWKWMWMLKPVTLNRDCNLWNVSRASVLQILFIWEMTEILKFHLSISQALVKAAFLLVWMICSLFIDNHSSSSSSHTKKKMRSL